MLDCTKHGVEFQYSNDGYDFRSARIADVAEFIENYEYALLIALEEALSEEYPRAVEIKEILAKCWDWIAGRYPHADVELTGSAQEFLDGIMKPDDFS